MKEKYQGKTIHQRLKIISNRTAIAVESSDYCNNNCSHCLVKDRLKDPKSKINENFVNVIIKKVPKKSFLLFVGLGEPLLKESQKRIEEILTNREDIIGYIQTNGLSKLNNKLIDFVEKGRLEIGLSYDSHHLKNGGKINIQKEYVEALTICYDGKDQFNENLNKEFPNINRVVIEPLIDNKTFKVITPWKKLKKFIEKYTIKYPEIKFITEIDFYLEKLDKNYTKDVLSENWIEIDKSWKMHENEFYFYRGYGNIDYRILTNGKVLNLLTKDLNLIKTFDEINAASIEMNNIWS